MKKLTFALVGLLIFSAAWADNIKVSTTTSALVDSAGSDKRPGMLLKFEFPAVLQKARIDVAFLRFKVETDSAQRTLGLLVRPMLESWASGVRLSTLPDSKASPYRIDFGRLALKNGSGKVEITQAVKAWQTGELSNFGLLVYPDEEKKGSFQLKNLPDGGVAELEIFYTAPEVVKSSDATVAK